jgi:MoaA/NifB/PqqE/SkfB family radical SAM enzyme
MSMIRLTDKCNEKCLFCNIPSNCQTLVLSRVKKEMKDNMSKSICFTGGEPTIYPFIEEAIKYARKQGIKDIELQSNCLIFANKALVEKFKRLGLTSVFVTIHSGNEKLFETITQVKGSFSRTIAGIKNLIEAKINIRINVVINSFNYKELLDITIFIHKNFPDILSIDYSFIVPSEKVIKSPFLLPKITPVLPYLRKAYKYCEKNNIKFINPGCGLPLCFIPQYKNISLEYKLLKNKKNKYLINNQKEKVKFPKCLRCEFDHYCLGYWRNYLKIHGSKEFI